VRGQVVHLRPVPGVPCVCDEDELTYVLPRGDVIVCGGTHQPLDTDTSPREDETRDILERCIRLVPALADAEVLGAKAGLRPVRRGGVRLEREDNVIHCYGHGGAGVTLSWGCARAVVEIARTAAAR
jgi:D-amino-acid oxidase